MFSYFHVLKPLHFKPLASACHVLWKSLIFAYWSCQYHDIVPTESVVSISSVATPASSVPSCKRYGIQCVYTAALFTPEVLQYKLTHRIRCTVSHVILPLPKLSPPKFPPLPMKLSPPPPPPRSENEKHMMIWNSTLYIINNNQMQCFEYYNNDLLWNVNVYLRIRRSS